MEASALIAITDYARVNCSPTANAALASLVAPRASVPFRRRADVPAISAISVVANAEQRPVASVLESYGRFFVEWAQPAFGEAFGAPDARTLLASAAWMSAIARAVTRGATPPEIAVEEPSPERLVIVFASPRGLCAALRGVIRGIADHYGEHVTVHESACMSG